MAPVVFQTSKLISGLIKMTEDKKVWDHGNARWKITLPDGEEVLVESLRRYCDAHDLNYQMILRKHHNQDDPYKDYKLEKLSDDAS